jgi:hypothetical protein
MEPDGWGLLIVRGSFHTLAREQFNSGYSREASEEVARIYEQDLAQETFVIVSS